MRCVSRLRFFRVAPRAPLRFKVAAQVAPSIKQLHDDILEQEQISMEADEADPVPLLAALPSAPAPPPTSSSSASSAAPRPATSIDWPSYDACVTVDPRNNRYKQVRNQGGVVAGKLQPLLPTSGKYMFSPYAIAPLTASLDARAVAVGVRARRTLTGSTECWPNGS